MTKSNEEKEATPITEWNIHFKLVYIQEKLKARKDQTKQGLKYSYRNNENIIEALKPLLKECQLILNQSDEIVQIGDRFYVKATSKLYDGAGENISATAYAREPLKLLAMSEPQVSGSCSTYARKYSICGLLALDDSTNDPDSENNEKFQKEEAKKLAFDKKVISDLKIWMDTTDKYTTMKQWETAMNALEKNRKDNNRVSLDDRFYKPLIERYNRIKEIGIDSVEE